MMTTSRASSGIRGEQMARAFLESFDYRFIDSNFRQRVGELDLIMLEPAGLDKRRTIVFVEVRYRATGSFGGALASVDWKKQRKLIRVSNLWLQRHACSKANARIDVIAIEPIKQRHMKLQADEHQWNAHSVLWIKNAVEST